MELGKYGINMNHMIALKSLESSFLRQIFKYFDQRVSIAKILSNTANFFLFTLPFYET